MDHGRTAGVLLHPTSLPGPYGIGELGSEAYRFADYLKGAHQGIWQVLPLVPTGPSHSPYQSYSSFAGNPLLISIERLLEEGLLEKSDLGSVPPSSDDRVDFEALVPWKRPLLRKAYSKFLADATPEQKTQYERFAQGHGSWLDDYALFMALREAHDNRAWPDWPGDLAGRNAEALARWNLDHAEEVDAHRFYQYLFSQHWDALRTYCNGLGIKIMGDIPIYAAHDSADCWAHPELFHLDGRGWPTLVAGVPPDYFSATGQLWGNPIYRWDRLAETGYAWWVDRVRSNFSRLDMLRIDHFRGFEAYWEVPASETTAAGGRWVEGPGAPLFDAIRAALGDVPIIAENLGIITPQVEFLRKSLGFSGMAVLQFAFGTDRENPGLLPHTYTPDTVAYTGTHDNNTTIGWWQAAMENSSLPEEQARLEREFARAYVDLDDEAINWAFIRTIMESIAGIAVAPLQDVLDLGGEARMNTPGTSEGNWRWRFRADMLDEGARGRLGYLTTLYGRAKGRASIDAVTGR